MWICPFVCVYTCTYACISTLHRCGQSGNMDKLMVIFEWRGSCKQRTKLPLLTGVGQITIEPKHKYSAKYAYKFTYRQTEKADDLLVSFHLSIHLSHACYLHFCHYAVCSLGMHTSINVCSSICPSAKLSLCMSASQFIFLTARLPA